MFLTIIIRVYNRADTIGRCLESVIKQSLINEIQILIVNDCSTDNTMDVINDYISNFPDLHWTVVSHEKNMGRGKALNTAKQYIKYKYCCVLDTDDEYCSDTWVNDIKQEIGDNEYDILYNGNMDEYHVKNIYLSNKFKICPISNLNYYEDHYTRWFFVNNFNVYQYNIPTYYTIRYDSNDRKTNEHLSTKYKFYNSYLKVLYEDVFYYRNDKDINDLIKRTKELDVDTLDDVLLESYVEIKQELKL